MERKLTPIQIVVNHYFETKDLDLDEIKAQAKSGEINYPRHTKAAKDLLELTGSIERACEAIDRIAEWASDNGMEYTIETAFKRFWEIKHLI